MAEREGRRSRVRAARKPDASSGAARAPASPLGEHAAAVGNAELARQLRAAGAQSRLEVSRPGDAHEVEANRLADEVTRMPDHGMQRQAEEEEEAVQAQAEEEEEAVQAQAEEEEEAVQRQAEEEAAEAVAAQPEEEAEEAVAAQPEEEAEEALAAQAEEQEEEAVQAQAEEEEEAVAAQAEEDEEAVAAQPEEETEEAVATSANTGGPVPAPVQSSINASRGAGQPLDSGSRSYFEPRFGRDLGGVRVHTDSPAASMARSMNAQAFTVGRDIYFSQGRYQPGTESGRHLLAHELTHTIQQRPGAKLASGPARPAVLHPSAAAPAVQRQTGTTAPAARQEEIPAEAGAVNENASPKEIRYPALKLPDFKATAHRGSAYRSRASSGQLRRSKDYARGRPEQTTVWDQSVPDAKVQPKIIEKLGSAYNPSEPQKTYALKHREGNFYLVGNLSRIVATAKRPIWDRGGIADPKDVDHMVELQIAGWTGSGGWANLGGLTGNMELLDSGANQDSGRKVLSEVTRLVKLTREHYHRTPSDPRGPVPGTDPSFWVKSRPPSLRSIKQRYDLVFGGISAETLSSTGNPQNYWTWDEVGERTQHLDQFEAVTGELGASDKWVIFPTPEGGAPKELAHTGGAAQEPSTAETGDPWLKPFQVKSKTLADPTTLAPDATTPIGSITMGLPANVRRIPYRLGRNTTVPIQRFPGMPYAGYLDHNMINTVWRALEIKGFSPVEIESWAIDPARGFMARGRLLPSIPIFAELDIQLIIEGDDLRLAKVFDIGDFNLPGPIQVTESTLEIFAGTTGIGARGEVQLAIEKVGTGTISARVTTDGEFALAGTFTFDRELFDPPSEIRMAYENGEFSGSGTLSIGAGRVTGIRSATVTASYEQGRFEATGTAQLDVPGVEQGTMTVTHSEEEGLAISGAFDLSSDIPGIRSGRVEASVAKRPGEEGYAVTARGTAEPDVPGFDTRLTVAYEDGIITAEARAEYERGMLSGSLLVGATNRPVDEEGRPGGGATRQLRAYGGGSLTLRIAPWLAATAGVQLTPEGEVEVSGEIGLPEALDLFPAKRFDKNIFSIAIDIPIVGVAAAGQRVGIFATIGGGLDLSAGFGPGRLEALSLGITYNPAREAETQVTGRAELVVPADAGLRLFVRGALGAGIPLVSATAGVEIGGQLGIQGALRAGVEVNWTPTTGLTLDAEAEIFAEPVFKFDITAFVLVELDLWLTSIELYSKRWTLAQFEYGSGLRLGAKFPVHYQEGQPFEPSIDDIEFQVPDIDARQLLSGLVERIV